jgi:hypothetical protein
MNAMPLSRQHRVDYWRSLAAEVLDAAVQAADSQARATLTSIAALYGELAIKAELQPPKHRASSIDPMPNSTEPPWTDGLPRRPGDALHFLSQRVMRPRGVVGSSECGAETDALWPTTPGRRATTLIGHDRPPGRPFTSKLSWKITEADDVS